ncbi:glycerophosphodiester phosphodiesterase [Candidatus Avelusimicrobium fimicolum]|uniref:glycerophosphodiester phosphodiesterase n=1 Tax=Candidatus Avelusimicrobium fimicolum TaxID=3416216 RepID=UPI003D14E96F
MLYFAHRGASQERVQNTLSAFSRARALGATRYELDVHLSKDGALLVHHDYSLLSTAGEDIPLAALTLADLKKYPLVNRLTKESVFVPQLQEVLPVVRPQLSCLNIELKNDNNRYPGLETAVLSCLCQAAPDILPKTLFSSFDYNTLVRLRKLDKNARIGLLTRFFDVSKALALGAESVHMNYTRFTPQIAQACHENGLKIYLYTVNDPLLATHLAEAGADGIFTDCIGAFVK